MPHWVPYFLLSFLGFFGGLSCLLLGWGVIPRRPQHPDLHARWLRRSGHLLRWLGPVLLLLGVLVPATAGYIPGLPPWARNVGLAVVAGAFLAFIVRTWEPEPPVLWPRGFWTWVGFCFGVFVWGAVLSGMLKAIGVDIDTEHWAFWALMIPGLVVHRGLQVWFTRLKHNHGRRMGASSARGGLGPPKEPGAGDGAPRSGGHASRANPGTTPADDAQSGRSSALCPTERTASATMCPRMHNGTANQSGRNHETSVFGRAPPPTPTFSDVDVHSGWDSRYFCAFDGT